MRFAGDMVVDPRLPWAILQVSSRTWWLSQARTMKAALASGPRPQRARRSCRPCPADLSVDEELELGVMGVVVAPGNRGAAGDGRWFPWGKGWGRGMEGRAGVVKAPAQEDQWPSVSAMTQRRRPSESHRPGSWPGRNLDVGIRVEEMGRAGRGPPCRTSSRQERRTAALPSRPASAREDDALAVDDAGEAVVAGFRARGVKTIRCPAGGAPTRNASPRPRSCTSSASGSPGDRLCRTSPRNPGDASQSHAPRGSVPRPPGTGGSRRAQTRKVLRAR